MFVFLSKFLPQFVYPLGFTIILLLSSIFFLKKERQLKAIILFAILVLWIGGNRWVSMALARSLEWQYLPRSTIPSADAIILLGGGTEPHQYPRPTVESNGASDRVIYAAYLYHQGKAPHILLTGGSIEWLDSRETSTPAQEMAVILKWLNVPDYALWIEDKSRNTQENVLYSQKILEENRVTRAILVTSAFHMPRSVLLFKKAGIDVIPAPTDFSITQVEWDTMMRFDPVTIFVNLMPTPGNLSMTTNALKEYFGIFVYRLRGWL